MRKLFSLLLVLALAFSAFACAAPATEATEAEAPAAEATEAPAEATAEETASEGFVIVGLYKMGTAEWFLQEGEASRQIIEAAGGTFKYMDCETDGAKFMEMLDTCIADKVDGVLTCIPDQNLSQAAGEVPFSYMHFYNHLSYLQSCGLILLVATKVGRAYTNQIRLLFDPEVESSTFKARFG